MPFIELAYFGLSIVVGLLGRKRAIGFIGFFFLSLFLTPLTASLLLLLTMPKRLDVSKA